MDNNLDSWEWVIRRLIRFSIGVLANLQANFEILNDIISHTARSGSTQLTDGWEGEVGTEEKWNVMTCQVYYFNYYRYVLSLNSLSLQRFYRIISHLCILYL